MDPRITNSEGGSLNSQRHSGVYGNSLGFLAGVSSTSHSVSCSLIAQQGDEMQRDYWYTTARDPADLESPDAIGKIAGQRAVSRLGSRKLSTRKAPIAFTPDMARGLVKHFAGGDPRRRAVSEGFFPAGCGGKQVFPTFLQIQERPHIPKGLASNPFDDEGAATKDRDLIRDGVLDGYVLGSYSARRLGLKSTGNAGGVHNLIVSTPGKALDTQSFLTRMHTRPVGDGVDGAGR